MDLFERRGLPEIVSSVMELLGKAAPIQDVMQGVRSTATKDEWEVFADASMTNSVRGELRRRDSAGRPEYLEVNGIYKALVLFSPSDYEDKARYYAKFSRANRDMIFLLRDACEEAHGSAFDAEEICREYGIGA